uniref:TFIIS central domain-containing protein n=1 Tax=Knipowitschia caucasica TaxID=637954 RepID=A0AAV2LZL3_KNICA
MCEDWSVLIPVEDQLKPHRDQAGSFLITRTTCDKTEITSIMDSPTDCSSPVEQQPESETNPSNKPSLAQFKKSWGFRRSTIAKREFMEEVGDVNTSPPLVRKSRGRRSKTSLQTTPSAQDKKKASCSSKIDLDELEWSAPSSPASEEGKTPSEPSTGASMDPSMWQSFGSAFHTAFSLLGGTDGSLLDMGQAVATQNLIGSDCMVEQDQSIAGQFDDAADVGREESVTDMLYVPDPDVVCRICEQTQDNRSMICCTSCQGWFHGDCVGDMKTEGKEYVCLVCIEPNLLQADLSIPPDLGMNPLKSMIQSPPAEDNEELENQQTQESVYCGSDCIMQHAAATIKNLSVPKSPKTRARAQRKAAPPQPPAKSQRASRASKRLANREVPEESVEEEEKPESHSSQTCNPSITEAQATQCNASTVEDLGVTTEASEAVTQASAEAMAPVSVPPLKDSTPSLRNLPPLKDSTSIAKTIPPLKDFTPTLRNLPPLKDSTSTAKTIPPLKDFTPISKNVPQPKEDSLKSKPVPEPTQPPPEKAKDSPSNKNISKLSSAKVNSPKMSEATTPTKAAHSQAATKQTKPAETPSPTLPVSRMHQTGAIVVKKTAYVIPKKAPPPQPPANQVPAPPIQGPAKKPSPAPAVQTETRNLPVPPAPSAPSSRLPSQPNNQVRQSIQRSLVGILFKRVCDSEELDMSENDVGKLVTNIETEMFNIFRNTDSKYMNKYRTIMFNLKDPKNKGLLYRLVQGEISPFRLVRMSQKDMQAIQLPEPTVKEVKAAPCGAGSLQKPEPVKLDLRSLIQTRSDRTKNVPQQALRKTEPIVKSKTTTQSSKAIGTAADILTCMLKDTTSDHHKHLFDVKCKICTGQMPQEDVAEPVQKKLKLSEDKREPLWKRSKEDSPLRAPPDSPDMDSFMPHMGSPVLTIVESPVSPTTQDSPASPILDTPASPVMESPASPTSDDRHLAARKSYAPVVIPAVSTVTITRRDPRTAASRYAALTNSSATLGEKETQKTDSYFPSKGNSSAPPVPFPTAPALPKSILTKPSHSGDPRLYGSSSRMSSPKVLPQGGTVQFLAKQDILWKGFLNMLTIAKFVTKGYLVSGSSEHLKTDLPDTIQIGGRILPKTVWDYVAKLKTSVTKDLCVIRFQPATDEEEVAYVSLFSYFSSRGRFGVVANSSHSIKDMYLFPLSAKEAVPAILQPLEGPGFEKGRPNLLLGLAVVQKTKRPGCQAPEHHTSKFTSKTNFQLCLFLYNGTC